jgi:sugar O-acyltransferase (sialic acid O-acetyltransferase NeuD family)
VPEVATVMSVIWILGSGGHAAVVVDLVEALGSHRIGGLSDPDPARWGKEVLGHLVVGPDERVLELADASDRFVAALGAGSLRARVFAAACARIAACDVLVHPRATVARSAALGNGTCVFANAVVNPRGSVGVDCIVNTGAIVEHDCVVGDHAHVAPGSVLAGGAQVGEGSLVGARAVVLPGVTVGRWCTVGAGAVVTRDVPDGATVRGVPAR